jgi:hypothetical protein
MHLDIDPTSLDMRILPATASRGLARDRLGAKSSRGAG